MTKILLFATLLFSFTLQAQANCTKSDPAAESKMIRMFQLSGSPVDWVAVKKSTNKETKQVTIKKNRAFKVQVLPSRRLNSSRIIFRNDSYGLEEAKICFNGKGHLKITRNGKSLTVRRKGKSVRDSVILLSTSGIKIRLRPQALLGKKNSVVL
jgi:hypothetical protein